MNRPGSAQRTDSRTVASWGLAIIAMLIWGPDVWAVVSVWLEAKLSRQYDPDLAGLIYLGIQLAFYAVGAAILQHSFWIALTMAATAIASLTIRLPGFAG